MSMFEQPYVVTFNPEVLNCGVSQGTVRGAYQNPVIAPDEKILVVEVDTDLDEVNELTKVNTTNGWVNAILTEDAEPYFTEGEPLESVKAMMNMADAVLANKLHPCVNGDIFGFGQMFTSENLTNFREVGFNLGLADGPQLQTYLIANPLFEIAVGDENVEELNGFMHQFDEVQSAFDKGKEVWGEFVKNYRTGDAIAIYHPDTGTYDACVGMYLGRTDDMFGRSEHVGICNRGIYTYQDNFSLQLNVAKSLIPFEDMDGQLELVDSQRVRSDYGWVPEPELILRAATLPFIAEDITDINSLQVDMFYSVNDEAEG